jgi:alpha-ketoglutaric semialdehyde dehydrogenase
MNNNYINGEWVEPSTHTYYEKYNPADEHELIGEFPFSSGQDVEAAVDSAQKAFRTWGKMLPVEREKYIARFIQLLAENKEKIGNAICLEQGKPIQDAYVEPARSVAECNFFLGEGQRLEGITLPSDRKGVTSVAMRVPIGVVAAISPWNFPFLTPIRKIIPALISGDTVVFKPAYDTPLSAGLLLDLFHQADFPKGVVNLVIGRGKEIGDAISGHPLVRGITFTGSTAVGRRINELAARNFTRVQLEMGGKNPAIVAHCNDINDAASQITSSAFALSGQRCTAISRVIVLREESQELVRLIGEKMAAYRIGPGNDPTVNIGPIINRKAGEEILGYIQSAKDEGAVVYKGGAQLCGGIYDKGCYIEPTLITNVTPQMKVAQEEIFGPVLVVITVDSFEEALQVANDTPYGLSACLFSNELPFIYTFLLDIESGMAHVNHGTVTDNTMPFGGVKASGLGPFSKGKTNKDFFTTYKVTYVKWK